MSIVLDRSYEIAARDGADALKEYLDGYFQGLTERHYGPGPHPGTGTSQEVHGGEFGGFGGQPSEQIQRYRDRLVNSKPRFATGRIGSPTDISAATFGEAVDEMKRQGYSQIEAVDAERGFWGSFMFRDEVIQRDDIDWDAEFQMFLDAHDYMVEALNDPEFAALTGQIDRHGERMTDDARMFVERLNALRESGQEMGRLDHRFGYNVVFSNDRDTVGAGSSGVGGRNAKVFWQPLTMAEDEQVLKSGGFIFGTSPAYVQFHEMHHGFGSASELDKFSDTIASDFYISRYDSLPSYLQREVDREVWSSYNNASQRLSGRYAPSRLASRRASAWLYSRHPEFYERMWAERRAYTADDTGELPYSEWINDPDQSEAHLKRWLREYR